jgi:dihydropteroate synthase
MNINCRGQLLDFSSPQIMGILNLTPDSFYDGGRLSSDTVLLNRAEQMLEEGAAILDVGGMSSRPGAEIISEEEELRRMVPSLEKIVQRFPECILSVDTIRAKVAGEALGMGAHIVNDISGGRFDEAMLATVAKWKAPFVIMHMQGLPANMQQNPHYENVVTEVYDFFRERIKNCSESGITDIILDPGFGFGKSIEHNYALLRELRYFTNLRLPLLAGLSRKSPICKVLKVNPEKALNGTTAANMIALMNGANILRVHDVKEAKEAIGIFEACYPTITLPV